MLNESISMLLMGKDKIGNHIFPYDTTINRKTHGFILNNMTK